MPTRRTKSAKNIQDQAYRIVSKSAARVYRSGVIVNNMREYNRQIRRMERVQAISNRYTNNISRSFGNRDGFIPNEQYRTQVSRRIYMGLANG